MATLYESCDAINIDVTLSRDEKARQQATLKAAGLRDALLVSWVFPKTFGFSKSGHVYSVTIISVSVRSVTAPDGLTRDILSITGSATKDGTMIKNADGSKLFPIEFYNPPCLIADGIGPVNRNGRQCTYDLPALVQLLLTNAVAS